MKILFVSIPVILLVGCAHTPKSTDCRPDFTWQGPSSACGAARATPAAAPVAEYIAGERRIKIYDKIQFEFGKAELLFDSY